MWIHEGIHRMWVYDSARKSAVNVASGKKISIGGSGSSFFILTSPESHQMGSYASESAAETGILVLLTAMGYVNVPA